MPGPWRNAEGLVLRSLRLLAKLSVLDVLDHCGLQPIPLGYQPFGARTEGGNPITYLPRSQLDANNQVMPKLGYLLIRLTLRALI